MSKAPQDDDLIEIVIPGHAIAKKNKLALTKRGHGYYPADVRARLDEMDASVSAQWGGRPPLRHPAIGMYFALASSKSDRDGAFTTVLDCLVNGGVLEDDRIECCNGVYVVMPGSVSRVSPMTYVWLRPDGDVAPLVRKMAEVAFLRQLPASPVLKRRRSSWKP